MVVALAAAQGLDELPPEPAAELPASVDVSSQLAPEKRQQKGLNSCHAFTTVALMEAAYFRRTGRRIRLSEADLFLRMQLKNPAPLRAREGGLLRDDLRVALEEGVLPGDHYAVFVERHQALKGKALRSRAETEAALLPESLGEEPARARAAVAAALSDARIEGPGGMRFAGSAARTAVKNAPVRCESRDKRRDLLMRALASGVPVGAGFLLDGLPEPWRSRGGAWGGPHYFVLTGYETRAEGVFFRTRNSWGDDPALSPDLDEAALCALFGVSWLR